MSSEGNANSGAPAPPGSDPLIGRVFADRYRVVRKLGEGGMGSVYSAVHITLEKQLALKVLHGEYSRKPDLVERFLQEARSASLIAHENVIDITDFGITEDGCVFIAMELLSGKDLHEVIARSVIEGNQLQWPRVRDIFLQICGALSAAHKCGIVHRDLKPENIFLIDWLGKQDFVKLLDFGIAKITESVGSEGRKLTRTGMLFGTPEYMSPEQAMGKPVDHRIDVYAMGCILFQLLAGKVPFGGDNFMAVLNLHLSAPVPPIDPERLARANAPAAVTAIIARALQKDRDARYRSIDELADAVRLVDIAGRPTVQDSVSETRQVPLAVPQPTSRGDSQAEGQRRKRTEWTGSVRPLEHIESTQLGRGYGSVLWVLGGVAAVVVGAAIAWAMTKDDTATANSPLPAAVRFAGEESITPTKPSAPEPSTPVWPPLGGDKASESGDSATTAVVPARSTHSKRSREPRRGRGSDASEKLELPDVGHLADDDSVVPGSIETTDALNRGTTGSDKASVTDKEPVIQKSTEADTPKVKAPTPATNKSCLRPNGTLDPFCEK